MATKAKPKPKPVRDLRLDAPTSSLSGPYLGKGGLANLAKVATPAAHTPTLQEIADAFGGADKAVAYSKSLATPPEGSYDPQLDIQGLNEKNNYIWGGDDRETARARAYSDYLAQTSQRDTTHGYSLSDLQQASTRGLADYNTRTQDLGTQYGRLGTSQTQQANAAGVGGGGALVAAAAARAGNQQHDQSAIDTGWTRQQQDIATSTDRENAAYNADRVAVPGTGAAGGLMGLAYNRYAGAGGDLDTQGARASDTYYNVFQPGLDQAKVTSAQQGGWLQDPTKAPTPAKKPYEEFTSYSGTHKGIVYHRYPDGRVVPVRKVGY